MKYLINCLKISGKIFRLIFHVNRNTLFYNVMYLSAVRRLHKTRNYSVKELESRVMDTQLESHCGLHLE